MSRLGVFVHDRSSWRWTEILSPRNSLSSKSVRGFGRPVTQQSNPSLLTPFAAPHTTLRSNVITSALAQLWLRGQTREWHYQLEESKVMENRIQLS